MKVLAATVATVLLLVHAAWAEEPVPLELKDISIEEKPGAQLPLDVQLTNQDGRTVALSSYFGDGKPVVLAFAYYTCPMLCPLLVNGITEGAKGLAWTAGDQYRVLVISFDPKDTPAMAAEKRDTYVHDYGRRVGERGFDFLVGDAAQVRRLADAVGFHYKWDDATRQYAHAAGAFLLTPAGKLSRTMYGISFPSNDLRLALLEASEGKLATAWDQVVLFCFHYDPAARGYVLAATRLMRAGGALSALLVAILLARMFRRERRQPTHAVPVQGRGS